MDGEARTPPIALPQLVLVAVFVTALITAQVTAAKVVAFDLPFSVPLTGAELLVPAAVFAYAVTFLASDCYTELYGKRAAQSLVNVAFAMNLLLLVLIWVAILAPPFEGSPVGQEPFATTLGASTGIVAGSLLAYLVSQHWDIFVFHRLREHTAGKFLWLRNVASTATSQLLDTAIFIGVAFVLFQGLPLGDAVALALGQYLVKLGLVVFDTPFVYLAVGGIRRYQQGELTHSTGSAKP